MNLFYFELKKLFKLFISDPKPLAAGLIAPSAVLIIFCLIFGNFSSLPIKIVNYDRGIYGEQLVTSILSQISPLGGEAYFKDISQEADKKPVCTITVPSEFSSNILQKNHPRIILDIDNFNSDFAKNIRLYLQEGIVSFYADNYPQWNISLKELVPSSGQVEWVEIIASGSILLAAALGGMFLYLYLFFKERTYGTLVFYSLAPRSLLSSFLARVFICWGFAVINITINIILAYLLTGRNFFLHSLIIYPVLSLVAINFILLSSLISTFSKKFFTAAMITMFGCILVWFISGGMNIAPIDNSTFTGFISLLFPNRYALEIIRSNVFMKSNENMMSNAIILTGMVLFPGITAYGAFYRVIYKAKN